MSRFRWPLLAVFALLGGCINLAPEYERPQAPVAEQWLAGAIDRGVTERAQAARQVVHAVAQRGHGCQHLVARGRPHPDRKSVV